MSDKTKKGQRKGLKILWHSVSPHIRSGYGNVTRQVTSRLVDHGYSVFVSAYYGIEPGGVMIINNVPVLPSKHGSFGETSFLKYYRDLKANLGILHSDPWAFGWFPEKVPNSLCYDPHTEVLTGDGWKHFKDLKYSDLLATLNDNGQLEYHRPKEIIELDYSGDMYHLKTTYIDMMVTPEHRLYVKMMCKNDYEVIEARNAFGKYKTFKKDCIWTGKDVESFSVPVSRSYHRNRKIKDRIPIRTWLRFLAWYVSEGIINRHRLTITQSSKVHPEYTNEIANVLDEMGVDYTIYEDIRNGVTRFHIHCGPLREYLTLNVGAIANEKRIPKDILELNTDLLRYFVDELMKGDGNKDRFRYTTVSRQLADCLQEIGLKIGRPVDFFISRSDNQDVYKVNFLSDRHREVRDRHRTLGLGKRSVEEWVPYSGKVYCVIVDNHRIYVRRNGKAYWCMNCYGPLDHINYPEEIRTIIRGYKYRISPSYFQKKEWESYNPPVIYDDVIYHGVDTAVFYKMDKKKCRKALGLPEDAFIIGQVAANSDKEPRKGYTQGIQAIRMFLDDNPDVKKSEIRYVLHTNPVDPRGLNVDLILRKYDLKDIAVLQDPMLFETGLKDQELAVIYNAMDVHFYPSMREGFGIPILEGMACGVPAICNDFSSMTELVTGRGWLAEPLTRHHITPINAETSIPNPYTLKKCLEEAYFNRKLLEKYSLESIKFAIEYDWDIIVSNKWVPFLDSLLDKMVPRELEERRLV